MLKFWYFVCIAAVCFLPSSAFTQHTTSNANVRAYNTAWETLVKGDQSKAEEILYSAVNKDASNQRLVFFMGVCERSRWNKQGSTATFAYVEKMNPATPEGKCAALMMGIDNAEQYKPYMDLLEKLQKKHSDDPLLLWMTAVACRELCRKGDEYLYAEKGADYYGKLLKLMNPGPVLLHQTYANILSENLGRHEEALKHSRIAVQMEPQAWSYHGLAGTLAALYRYEEADNAFRNCVRLDPDNPKYWYAWALALRKRGDYKEALKKYRKAAESKGFVKDSVKGEALCLFMMGKEKEAKTLLDQILSTAPNDPNLKEEIKDWEKHIIEIKSKENNRIALTNIDSKQIATIQIFAPWKNIIIWETTNRNDLISFAQSCGDIRNSSETVPQENVASHHEIDVLMKDGSKHQLSLHIRTPKKGPLWGQIIKTDPTREKSRSNIASFESNKLQAWFEQRSSKIRNNKGSDAKD